MVRRIGTERRLDLSFGTGQIPGLEHLLTQHEMGPCDVLCRQVYLVRKITCPLHARERVLYVAMNPRQRSLPRRTEILATAMWPAIDGVSEFSKCRRRVVVIAHFKLGVSEERLRFRIFASQFQRSLATRCRFGKAVLGKLDRSQSHICSGRLRMF